VTKVTGAELIGLLARGTDLAIFDNAKPGVKDAVWHRLVALIRFVSGDFHDRTLQDVFRVRNAELNSNDCVAHFTTCYP
jgi:UDP-glucose 4-epimerase